MKFKNTKDFFEYIDQLIISNQSKKAGLLFQEFTKEWHMVFGDYVEVYDNPTFDSVPIEILERIDGVDFFSKIGNGDAFGIDKICVARSGEIDIHQDKSTTYKDKKLSANKATAMMSCRENPFKNIRNYVINTTAVDISHYVELWKNQKPIIFNGEEFLPDYDDCEAQSRDEMLWMNIRRRRFGFKAKPIYDFTPRNQNQTDYIDAHISFVKSNLIKKFEAKWYQKGVGGLGKSVLDSVLLGTIQKNYWTKELTETPVAISVDFYHSSKTLNANGWEHICRRRAMGLYDRVVIVSGTKIIDKENSSQAISKKFTMTTNALATFKEIQKAIELGQTVLIITLYHHAEIIEEVLNLIRAKINKKARFWTRKRDECDWPCSNVDSSFAPALDKRTESVITFGSSGTDRFGDPYKDYGTNNINIHGPCLYDLGWSKAEDEGLVKPLILLTPQILMSEVAKLFPDLIDKKKLELSYRVKGIPVDNVYPTAEMIVKLVAIIKTLQRFPEIQRIMAFANFIRNNKLAEANWKMVADRVLGKDKNAQRVKKIFWTVLNDEQFNSNPKTLKQAIKIAKAKQNYIVGSCRSTGRGYNDESKNKKHHAGFHLDDRNLVDLVQNIWRVVRIDENKDPFAYYICPLIYNDMDPDKPTWSQQTIQTLKAIFKHNIRIKEDFESQVQKGSGEKSRKKGSKRIWLLKEIDEALLGDLVDVIATTSKGEYFNGLVMDAHNWLTEEMMKLAYPTSRNRGEVFKKFEKIEKFQPLHRQWKFDSWMQGFWNCKKSYYDKEIRQKMMMNRVAFDEHQSKMLKQVDDSIENFYAKCRKWWDDRPQYDHLVYPTKGVMDNSWTKFQRKLFKDMKIKKCFARVRVGFLKSNPDWIVKRRKRVKSIVDEILRYAIKNYKYTNFGHKEILKDHFENKGIPRSLVNSVLATGLTGGNNAHQFKLDKKPIQSLADIKLLEQWKKKMALEFYLNMKGLTMAAEIFHKNNGFVPKKNAINTGVPRTFAEKGYKNIVRDQVNKKGYKLPSNQVIYKKDQVGADMVFQFIKTKMKPGIKTKPYTHKFFNTLEGLRHLGEKTNYDIKEIEKIA